MKITEKKNLQYCTKVSCASNKRSLLVIFLSDKYPNKQNKAIYSRQTVSESHVLEK